MNFSIPDPSDNGIRHAEYISEGPVSPLIFLYTVHEYLDGYLGRHDPENFTAVDWLAFSEHRLLALTAGKLFIDGLHLQDIRDQLRFYPNDVRLYLIASNWSLLAEEQAFVKRCAAVGDETGSALVCGRIAERETNLVQAQKSMADWHNTLGLTEPVDVKIQSYFGRDILVIYADRIAQAAQEALAGTSLAHAPLIGSVSEIANFTVLFDYPKYQKNIKALYEPQI